MLINLLTKLLDFGSSVAEVLFWLGLIIIFLVLGGILATGVAIILLA